MSVTKHVAGLVHSLLKFRVGLQHPGSRCHCDDEEHEGRDVEDDVEKVRDC